MNISKHIKIVDARMGRGKSSAAIRYMNENKGKRCFLYITPYLTEVDRVCELCRFAEPGQDYACKSIQLKELMRKKKNIASTHVLFSLMDSEALALAEENGYSLIIDEVVPVVEQINVSQKDLSMLLETYITTDDEGFVTWSDPNYTGVFKGYKDLADAGTLRYCYGTLVSVLDPRRIACFDEVIMMTYLFGGQIQKAYLDFFGFTYDIVGVTKDDKGFLFSDKPDDPAPVDFSKLIRIIGEGDCDQSEVKMNEVGESRAALSLSWFNKRGQKNKETRALRGNLRKFFERTTEGTANDRLWTTFKGSYDNVVGYGGRFAASFLSLNARATNRYRDRTRVAYLANRFVNPNVAKFFYIKGIVIDQDQYALSEMLQFIWRSAIRDDKPITVYIPSKRMRKLLIDWIEEMNTGKEEEAA